MHNAEMDIKQIRRANLALLKAEVYGSQKALADKLSSSPAYISQILTEKATREVGNSLARRAELAFDKPPGWMDKDHSREAALEHSKKLFNEYESGLGPREPILGEVQVPWYAVSASMGPGNSVPEEDLVDYVGINEKVLLQYGMNPKQAAITGVVGNSMYDTLTDGDLVLVDKTPVNRLSGDIYILWSDRVGLQAKRVNMSADGSAIDIISDNSDKTLYPTLSLTPEDFEQTFKVRATVVRVYMGAIRRK